MNTWQPTETAPRDGTRIIGWFGDRAIVVFWRSGPEYIGGRGTGQTVWYWSDGYSRFREADCWQPEPSPPDAVEFPAKAPPQAPRGSTAVVRSPAARKRVVVSTAPRRVLVEGPPKREVIREVSPPRSDDTGRKWCGQCERRVPQDQINACSSPFCKAKAEAA